jgi:hypothetical protein
MSSTTNSAATVRETADEPATASINVLEEHATAADPMLEATDAHVIVAGGAGSDRDGDAAESETEASTASADTSEDDREQGPQVDTLAQQLEQLVQSVSVVEDLSRRAREIASTDLARYDALLNSQQQYETGLDQARAIRNQALEVHERAFGQEAKSAAEPLVADAERVLQAFTELSTAWQERASAFLQQHPDINFLQLERDADAERARQAELAAAHVRQLQTLIAACDDAIRQGVLKEARRLIDVIATEFPEQTGTREQLRLSLQRRERADKDDVALQALAACAEHQARGDLEAAVNALEQVDVLGRSVDVSQDVFGRWSDVCSRHAQLSGTTLYRYAPAQGRGVILYADPAYPNGLIVFSSLGMGPGFKQGKVVIDLAILHRARTFREAAPLPTTSWGSFGTMPSSTPVPAPVRH